MRGMFKVTFRNAGSTRDLTKTLMLPVVPSVGERVHIRQKQDSWRAQIGTVTSREWFICDEEPNASDVIVMVQIDS